MNLLLNDGRWSTKKVYLAVFLSFALVFGHLPIHALAESTEDDSAELTDEQIAQIKEPEEQGEFEDLIDAADEELEVNEQGYFIIGDKAGLKREIGSDDYKLVKKAVAMTNELKESGELEITDNGTVYDADDESLMIQGKKNINESEWHWWGLKKWYSYANAKKAADKFWAWGFGAATAGSVAAFLNAPLSLALIATGAQGQLVSHDITRYNKKKHGVVLRLTWLYYCTVQTQ